MKVLVEELAKALVNDPDAVSAAEVPDEHGTTIQLRVSPNDVGKVIGKQGRTARSIRALLNAAGVKRNHRYTLDILE